jgi:tetratricopeptide (TPR) repeat protein
MTEVHRSYVGSLTGDHRLAVTAARTVQRLGAELPDRYLLAEGRLAEGQALVLAGSPVTVPDLLEPDIEYLRTAIGSDRRGQTTTRVVTSLTFLPVAYAQLGRFADARRRLAERTAIAQAGGRPFDLAFCGWCAGVIEVHADRPAAAMGQFEEGLEIARSHDLLYVDALICAHLGGVQALLGEPDAALRTLDRATGFARMMQSELIIAWADAHRAQAHLALGQPSAARDAATAALTFARTHAHPLLEATSLRWLAAAAQDRDAADACLRAALDVCDRVGLVATREHLQRARTALTRPAR